MTMVQVCWVEWTSYDVIKHHMITTKVDYQNNFKCNYYTPFYAHA